MYNKAILIGRLTADPELRQTQNGTSVTSFTLAVDRAYAQNGERKTDFINCVAWRNTAEFIAKYFSKGRLLGIDGSIQTRSYEDKNGNKRTAVEVVVDNAFFTESKASAQSGNSTAPQPNANGFEELAPDEDLPW